MTQLQAGKSLSDVAKANDKTVDGLVAAMVADAKQHIAADVAAGRLTEAQQTQILSDLRAAHHRHGERHHAAAAGLRRPWPGTGPGAVLVARDGSLMEPARPSRIEEARHRASRAKTALGAGAAVAFAAAAGLAWSGHSGKTASTRPLRRAPRPRCPPRTTAAPTTPNDDNSGFSFGSGSVSPSSGSQPQVGTSVS